MNETPDYDSKYELKDYPEMWLDEIKYIEETLIKLSQKNNKLNILEWGSGFSSIYFSKFLKQKGIQFKWVAVEHFVHWHEKVIDMIEENKLSNNIECVLKNATLETDKNIQETLPLNDYINYPSELDTKFDLIIVDGRKRSECLKVASNILTTDGVVILHDAEREWYHDGFKYYADGGEFVTFNTTPAARSGVQKLWVGRV